MVAAARRKKAALLVLGLMKNTRDPRTLTAKHLTEHVCVSNGMPETQARRTVQSVLKQGISFGLISKKRNGVYELTDMLKCMRQHRRRRSRSRGRRRRRRHSSRKRARHHKRSES